MKKVKIFNEDVSFEVEDDVNLLDALINHGYFIDNPCNGKGTCGKCKVRIHSGDPDEIGVSERRHIREKDEEDGLRLSCLVTDWTELEVELIQNERKTKVLTKGYVPDFEMHYKEGYGISIDIGTTTVAVSLVDLRDGETKADASMVNMQKNFGLDVLTRISYAADHPDGKDKLQEAIVGSINSMIGLLVEETGIDPDEILEIIVSANTTMAHLLMGVDSTSMGRYPYEPAFKESQKVLASDIGLEAGKDTILYTLPHVSAFIGSDVVAGVYVAEMEKKQENQLFIDIGTNGEIVLAKEGKLYSCSCAAGPALEGMNISCGMRAEPGAIEDVLISEEGVELKTIDDEKPIGICGSGILAVVKELLKVGLVKDRGVFVKKEDLAEDDYRYELIELDGKKREFLMHQSPRLVITQDDVRQVQLAKGAILSGFLALLNVAGITMDDLDVVYVAGQFGSHLPADSLVGTGILPAGVKDKIQYLGNSAKTGAYMALMNDDIKKDLDRIAKEIEYVELAVTENYESIFRKSMIYPKFEDGQLVEEV